MKRAEVGKDYGMVLLPEGLIEFFPEFLELLHEMLWFDRFVDNRYMSHERKYPCSNKQLVVIVISSSLFSLCSSSFLINANSTIVNIISSTKM